MCRKMRCSCYQPFIANFMTNIVTCSSFIRKIDNETEYGYHLANYLGNINVIPSSGLLIITLQHSNMHQNTVVQLTKLKLKTNGQSFQSCGGPVSCLNPSQRQAESANFALCLHLLAISVLLFKVEFSSLLAINSFSRVHRAQILDVGE